MTKIKSDNKERPHNGRFGASGGVARPTICADFQPFVPVRALVETPAYRQAASTLAVMRGQRSTIGKRKNKVK